MDDVNWAIFLVCPWMKCFNDSMVDQLNGIWWSSVVMIKSPRVRPWAQRMPRIISIQARWPILGGVCPMGTSCTSSPLHIWQQCFAYVFGFWVDVWKGVGGGVRLFFLFDGERGNLIADSRCPSEGESFWAFSWMCLAGEWWSSIFLHFLGTLLGVDDN